MTGVEQAVAAVELVVASTLVLFGLRHLRAQRSEPDDQLVQRLRAALRLRQFGLRYQPLVSASDGHVVGVEALLRWEDPLRGEVQPDDFVPLLEETGLIVPVGAWVLEEACRQAAIWHHSEMPAGDLTISVNVAPRQLMQPDFAATVARALDITGANPRQLCLEITEAALIQDVDAVRQELVQVRELGVRLAVDDFGTGYSSVGYVRQFPLDSVKIDKSFVQGLTAGAEDAAIAQAIIKMAHALGLSTVAEGVESAEELLRLQQLGCDMVQGFYFAAPLTADAVDGMMHANRELAIAS
ncbi:MAG: EAL domain-containing protein [Acidimicrobiia bacterium]|nr:EAL domain-containing protein [Acidimicrobiia bacterium]